MDATDIAEAPGYRRMALGEVGSTNALALAEARAGDPGNLWVTAERQTAGRGRRGRAWVSEAGNLYATLLLVDPAPASQFGTLPLVAALGVHRALRPLFERNPQALAVKWPNDILVEGRKVVGILLESEVAQDGRLAVAIGCGINCRQHPEDTSALYSTTDLAACGIDAGAEEVFPALARTMAETLRQWDRGNGFAAIRRDWLLAADGVGRMVTVRGKGYEESGIFEDIDANGYLLLNKGGERRRVSAGDLFFSPEGNSA